MFIVFKKNYPGTHGVAYKSCNEQQVFKNGPFMFIGLYQCVGYGGQSCAAEISSIQGLIILLHRISFKTR